MRAILITLAFGAGLLGVLAMLVHPSIGLVYDNPGVALGVGLIGLGACVHWRQNAAATTAAHQS
jgi:hypothetical protein